MNKEQCGGGFLGDISSFRSSVDPTTMTCGMDETDTGFLIQDLQVGQVTPHGRVIDAWGCPSDVHSCRYYDQVGLTQP